MRDRLCRYLGSFSAFLLLATAFVVRGWSAGRIQDEASARLRVEEAAFAWTGQVEQAGGAA